MQFQSLAKEQAHSLPKEPGVYLMKNESGVIIYVGKAKVLKNRVSSYFVKQKGRPNRLKHLIRQIHQIDYMVTSTEVEAFLLEASLIKKHRPKYNIRLKDDKAYPYIKCSLSEDYPKFSLVRKVNPSKDLFYGPYTSSYLVRETIDFLNGAYKVRDCANGFMKSRKRPCLSYEIQRCTAPCVEFTSKEAYRKQIKSALSFLDGKQKSLLAEIEEKMQEAAEKEEFEKAAEYRDQIKAAEAILQKQSVVAKEGIDRDVISFINHEKGILISMIHTRKGRVLANKVHFLSPIMSGLEENLRDKLLAFLNQYYLDNFIPDAILLDYDLGKDLSRLLVDVLKERKGRELSLLSSAPANLKALRDLAQKNAEDKIKKYIEKADKTEKALEEIQKKFHLPELPLRIECYDISNFQGDSSVGSQVVFSAGIPSPEDYRIYKIKTVVGSDDFRSLKEVLSRRLAHTEYQDPSLILIDGGKGQLSKARQALIELGREDIPIVGIAKSREKGSFEDKELQRTSERFFLPGRQNPVLFKNYSEALRILTHLRDEAHRFAISHHRKARDKKTFESHFEGLPGVGPKRLKEIQRFLSAQKDWSLVSEEQLKEELGLNKSIRQEVLRQIHSLVKDRKEERNEETSEVEVPILKGEIE